VWKESEISSALLPQLDGDRPGDIKQVEPEQVGKDRDEERQIDEGRNKSPARYDVAHAFERESKR